MSKFTKVYRKWHAKNNGKYDSAREYHKALMVKFGDWQPPKPLVVVPQIVADFIEVRKEELKLHGAFREIEECYGAELYNWVFQKRNGQDLFARAWIDGYMVEKEQMFYLKNVMTNNYLMQHKLDFRFGESDSKEDSPHWQTKFNQSEIDKLNTGSYEQIEVEP